MIHDLTVAFDGTQWCVRREGDERPVADGLEADAAVALARHRGEIDHVTVVILDAAGREVDRFDHRTGQGPFHEM